MSYGAQQYLASSSIREPCDQFLPQLQILSHCDFCNFPNICLQKIAGLTVELVTSGAWSARLMGWQERLAYLRDIGRWGQSIYLGLSMYDTALQGEPNLSSLAP